MNRRLLLTLTLGLSAPALLLSAPAAAQLPEGDEAGDEDELTDEEKRRIKEKIEAEEKARIEAEVREKLKKEAEAKARESQQSDAERRAAEEARRIEAEQQAREERLRLEALEKINARKRAEEEERMRVRAEIEAQMRAEQEAKIRAEEEARARAASATPPVSTTPALTAAERAEAERREKERLQFEAQTEEEDRKLREKLEKGRSVVAGVDAMHSWMVTFTEVPDAANPGVRKQVSSSNFFLSAGPRLGFFVGPEGMEINLGGGLLWRQIPVGAEGETAVEFDGYIGPGINFHIPMSPRLFFIMGADTAFFWGGGSRPLDLDNDPTTPAFDAETDALGFYGNIHAGPGYFINPVFQVRATLEGSALLGFETQKGLPVAGQAPENQSFFSPAFNTGIRIGIFAYF